MAVLRRSSQRMSGSIWPGFVDAMTALLLVLMFVLTIFMVVQSMLRDTITGQENELNALASEVQALAQALGLEQQRAFGLEEQLGTIRATLEQARSTAEVQTALIASLQSDIASQDARIASFEAQVASLLAERDDAIARGDALTADVATLEAAQQVLISEQEAMQLALAKAREEIDVAAEQARLAAARREALDALVAQLRSDADEREAALTTALSRAEQIQAALAGALEQSAVTDAALAAALLKVDQTDAELAAALERADATDEELAAAQARSEETNARLAAALAQLAENQEALSDAELSRLADQAAIQALRDRLQNSQDELTAMTLALEEQRKKAEDTLTLLAAADAARAQLENQTASQISETERQAALLAVARAALQEEESKSAQSERKVALLNQQVAQLRSQLSSLQAILDDRTERDVQSQVQIDTLTSRLNSALAQVAAEERRRAELEEAERKRLEIEAKRLEDEAKQLVNYRSEFFGRMREILGDREGVRIVGDRFVFSSEVLFEPGSADLADNGRVQIARVARILDEVSQEIPPQIDWVIRVDGHTDKTQLSGLGEYRDNWELSQARALSVVRYMTDSLGFSANRLAATGFGEYQPVVDGDSPEALAQNRRIELKLTEK